MPRTATGGGQPLPLWAKAVATELPRTAAAMLELDYAQRTRSPLDPALRAKMRWAIAHANNSPYGKAYALRDAITKLSTASPAIVVQDIDWEGGSSLVAYEIDGEGKSDTANLLVPVALTLRDKKGKETKKTVTYIVSTSPAITVFRDLFR